MTAPHSLHAAHVATVGGMNKLIQLDIEALQSSMATEFEAHAASLRDMVASLRSTHDDRSFEHAASLEILAMLHSRSFDEHNGAVEALTAQHDAHVAALDVINKQTQPDIDALQASLANGSDVHAAYLKDMDADLCGALARNCADQK